MTPELMKKQMTEAEWQKVYDMSKDKNLYHNLCSSLFPTIYGNGLIALQYICRCFVFDVRILGPYKRP